MFWEGVFVSIRNSLKIDKRFQKLMDLVLNFLTVSGPIKPCNVGLFAEPSHLTLGVASRITLDYTNRFLLRDRGIGGGDNMPIPDCLKGFRAGGNAAREQPADFFHQSRLEHPA